LVEIRLMGFMAKNYKSCNRNVNAFTVMEFGKKAYTPKYTNK